MKLAHILRWGKPRNAATFWLKLVPPRSQLLSWTPSITAVPSTVTLNHLGLCSPGPLMWQAGRPGPPPGPPGCPPGWADGTQQPLSQGLLELEQACPAPDDFPDHEASGRGPQLIVRSWETQGLLLDG